MLNYNLTVLAPAEAYAHIVRSRKNYAEGKTYGDYHYAKNPNNVFKCVFACRMLGSSFFRFGHYRLLAYFKALADYKIVLKCIVFGIFGDNIGIFFVHCFPLRKNYFL